MLKRRYQVLAVLAGVSLLASGCVKRSSGGSGTAGLWKEENQETTMETAAADSRGNTADRVIVTAVDEEQSQISVQSLETAKRYVVNYNGGTSIQNRFGREVLLSEIAIGEITELWYMSGIQKLISIKESDQAWESSNVKNWSIDSEKCFMTIGSEKFFFDENLLVFSDGKQIDIHQLNSVDTLLVRGVDKKVCSIDVETGHGYIKITDETNLIGGLVEVGTGIMKEITENMVIVAPEGEYTLTASRKGVGGSSTVQVVRNEEVTVSLSAFQGEVERQGAVKFHIKPEHMKYQVFIDGIETDISEAVSLSYGKHTIRITSDQYDDYTEDIVVSSLYMNKTITLSEDESDTSETQSGTQTVTGQQTQTSENTTVSSENQTTSQSENETTDTQQAEREDGLSVTKAETTNNSVGITGPAGAEVYFDGELKGIAPVTFEKTSGEHIFVLRRAGYVTTAYSYEFDESRQDVILNFPELEQK